jgi:multicomponent Na+:H+ antiporter subunit D
MAWRQDDLKRLLAYSTVAQIGYVLIGIGCASPAGFTAALYQVFSHMGAKMGIFLTAGLLIDGAKTRKIDELAGAGRCRPFLAVSFVFFASALVGLPPLNGFTSKWLLTLASLESGTALPALCLVAGTLISAGYYLKVIRSLLSPVPGRAPLDRKARPAALGCLICLIALCLVLTALLYMPELWKGLTLRLSRTAWDPSAYIRTVIGP